MHKTIFSAAAIAVFGAFVASYATDARAQAERPMLQEGKTALYQRVIAVPGAALVDAAGDMSDPRIVPPFSTYYVYDRQQQGDREWLQVGLNSTGDIEGWLAGEEAVDWQQTLTVAFRDPAQHERVLLFGDRDALKEIVDNNDAAAYRQLRAQAIEGTGAESPVVAVQPDRHVDIRRDFYLVPILGHEDVLVNGQQARLLRVATVPLQDSDAIVEAYRTGIVFVIDSTVSMKPYIDATRDVMQRVYRAIDEAELSDRVSYGIVAFRDNTSAVPGLDYVSRTFANLEDGISGDAFLSSIDEVRPATEPGIQRGCLRRCG